MGTWRAQTNDSTSFVISKHDYGYLVVAGDGDADSSYESVGVLGGHGDVFTVSFAGIGGPPAPTETIRLTVSPHNRLQATEKEMAGQKGPGYFAFVMMMPATLVKVSSSTTAPTPSP